MEITLMVFQLSLLLYIYLGFVALWFIFAAIGVYHMLKFGFAGFVTFFSTMVFIAVSILILSTSYYYIRRIDWEVNFATTDTNTSDSYITNF